MGNPRFRQLEIPAFNCVQTGNAAVDEGFQAVAVEADEAEGGGGLHGHFSRGLAAGGR